MLAIKPYIYSKLSTSTALATALGANGDITDEYPETIEKFPLIIFVDDSQRDAEFSDNLPNASRASFTVHIFTEALDGYPTTTALGVIVCGLFNADFWTVDSNGEVPDGIESVRHRVIRFSRSYISGEIL